MKYNKIIIAKTYQEYLDLCKEKWNKITDKKEEIYSGDEITYQIRLPEKAREIIKQSVDDNLNKILEMFINNYLKTAENESGDKCILEGILLTHEDYYYMLFDNDKIWYDTCCDRLTFKTK